MTIADDEARGGDDIVYAPMAWSDEDWRSVGDGVVCLLANRYPPAMRELLRRDRERAHQALP